MFKSFLFLHKNICCGYSLEVPQRGTSNGYPQHISTHNICLNEEIKTKRVSKAPVGIFYREISEILTSIWLQKVTLSRILLVTVKVTHKSELQQWHFQ